MAEPSQEAELSTRDLCYRYGEQWAVDDVTLKLRPGELTALIGPNGAGKSTLLQMLQGQLTPSHGEVLLGEQPIRSCRHQVALMPQRGRIDWRFPITALEMVKLRHSGKGAAVDRDAKAALASVGMEALGGARLGELSGGQQQRVLLASCLTQSSNTLLLDEPCSAMDPPARQKVLELLRDEAKSGRCICLSSHDWGTALQNYDRVIVLDRQLLFDGPPQQVGPQLNDLITSRSSWQH